VALKLTVRLHQDWKNGKMVLRLPRRALPHWAKRRSAVEVLISDDGGIHLLPTDNEPTATQSHQQIRGAHWGNR
jgi:hypothetical protein